MSEINAKSKEIATVKKATKHLKEISKKVHCEGLSLVAKCDKWNEEMFFITNQ